MKLNDFARRARMSYPAGPRRVPAWAAGRYGVDELGRATLAASIACLLLGLLPDLRFLAWAAFLLLATGYWRMFSRNTAKRYRENVAFLGYTMRVRQWWNGLGRSLATRKANHSYRCPSCRRKALVPRGTGRVKITCRECKTEFYKNA